MADRAYRCESCFLTADAVCLSKRLVVAAAGVFLRRRPFSERNGPHAGDDPRSNRFNRSLRASGARLLFIAAAFRSLDLSPASIEDHAAITKRSRRFLIQRPRSWKEAYAERFFSNSWICVCNCLFRCGLGFLRAGEAGDAGGRRAAACGAGGARARPCLRIL